MSCAGLIVEGGDLRHAWALHEVQIVENSCLDNLCQLRNATMDDLIISAWSADTDPSADRAVMPTRPRRDLAERLHVFFV